MSILEDTNLLKINYQKNKDPYSGTFILEPLSPGYGLTIGHALRRVLLSSLSGAAVSSVKIEGANHEFSTLPGVSEDVIEIILNLKSLRFKLHSDEPVTLKLHKKGAGDVKAMDFEKNSQVEIIDPDQHIAHLDKNGKIDIEATVKTGRGYEPVEKRKDEKMPLGTIAVDAIYTPVKKIHYEVENTRVGGMTNYDKIILEITTDGTITPENAFKTANQILIEHYNHISQKMAEKAKPASAEIQLELAVKKPKVKAIKAKTAYKPKKDKTSVKNTKKAKK